jgi:hypothetical protein
MVLTRYNSGSVRKEEVVQSAFQLMGDDQVEVNRFLSETFTLHAGQTPLQMAERSLDGYKTAMRLLQLRLQ